MVTVWGTLEPRAQLRLFYRGYGFEIWPGHPGKVLGVREDCGLSQHSHALVKALLEACQYCADENNGQEIRQMLSQREYVSTNVDYIHLGDPNSYVCSSEQHMRQHAHHLFYGRVNRPSRTEQLWHDQMARWGDTPFPGTGWKSWNGCVG